MSGPIGDMQALLGRLGMPFTSISFNKGRVRAHLNTKKDAQEAGRHLRDAKYQEITIRPAIEGFLLEADLPPSL